MSDNILISVVIPVYNTPAEKLSRCLDSVCADDTTAYEVILVDDGSRPEFSSAYRSVCGGRPNIRCFRKENGGAAQARNYGMERAAGEYVTFVDADDYISPNCLRQAGWIIEQEHPDLIVGLLRLCGGGSVHAIEDSGCALPDTQLFSQEERIRLLAQMFFPTNPELLFPNGYIGAGGPVAKMIRREKLLEVKFDETLAWAEDMVWNIQLMRACESIVLCKEPWYARSVYEQSISNGFRKDCLSEFQRAVTALWDVMNRCWPRELEGFDNIYLRIWNDIWILCRTLIFHPENTMPEREKRELLKRAIQTGAYQTALKHVRFHGPQSWINRFVKRFLRFAMYHGWYWLTYPMMKAISRVQNRRVHDMSASSA